jgi:hypothetical protein
MPVVVAIHRLKNFDEWFKLFKSNPPPKVGRWRILRGSEDRNRVHVVAELTESEAKELKDFIHPSTCRMCLSKLMTYPRCQ